MWQRLVEQREGVPLASVADAGAANLKGARFAAVLVDEEGALPLLARTQPDAAVALLLLADVPEEGAAAGAAVAANALRESLEHVGNPSLLVKGGRVGGAATEAGSREITEADAGAALDAALSEEAEWERDPDFGYELLVAGPGVDAGLRDLLVPRFLYRRADRVYEHAALVPELKRERGATLERIEGLDPAIAAALG